MQNYVYEFEDSLYLNLTNRCSNDCDFCIRNIKTGVSGHKLWLIEEPSAATVIAELDKMDLAPYKEVVFCGFGEPTCALSVIEEVGPYLKSRGARTRINTNGQSNLINEIENTAEIIAPYIDAVSVSLNAGSAEKYQEICHSEFGTEAFNAMLTFARQCVAAGINTTMSVVDCIGEEEIGRCAELAKQTGAHFRVRKTIKESDRY